MSKASDRLCPNHSQLSSFIPEDKNTHLISVVHTHRHTPPLELVHVHHGRLALRRRVHELELSWPGGDEVRRAVLVAESVTADDDGLDPAGDGLGNALEDDGLAEDGTAEDVTDLDVRKEIGMSLHLGRNRQEEEEQKVCLT